MSDAAQPRASARLVNCMINEGFLPRGEHGESVVYSPDVIRLASVKFYAHMIEHQPGGKQERWPWSKIKPGPRWKSTPNFGKDTLKELRNLAGIKDKPLKRIDVWVPEDRVDDIREMAKNMCEQSSP